MSLPNVTVVVPAFNAEAWIGDALTSVIAQSYSAAALEIVVVDDGCTDATLAVAEDVLRNCGIAHTVLSNAASMGPSAARNRGWRAGSGEWVQFLDADDRLARSKIARQADAAAACPESVAAVHSAWTRLVLRDEEWVAATPLVQPEVGDDSLVDVLRSDNFMQLGCLLFSRQWLERVDGFDESLRFIEDVDLLVRLVIAGGEFERLPSTEPLALYRQHSGSLSKSDDLEFVQGCVRNARVVERHWRGHGGITPTRARTLSGIYYVAARFFSSRDAQEFDRLVRDIYWLEPNFVPEEPRALRFLTRFLGYRRAERCAVQYRRFKRSLQPQAST